MKLLNVFLFLLLVFCLATPVYGESLIYGYQPDPIHFTETGNSYILSNSEMEVEFFTGTTGSNQYRNARNNEVLIYNSRVWVDYLGPGSKWKPAGIAQSVSYRQIPKGYEVTRHYTGIQANYDVIYTWVENRPLKYAVDITAGTAETFQVSWALDGVPNSRMIDKNIVSGNSNELVISIQDVIRSFGGDAVAVSESSSANGIKWDYTFGTWDLDFSNVSNNTHKVQVDPSIEFNGTNNWAGTSGSMVMNPNDFTLENDLEVSGYVSRYETYSNTGTNNDWNQTSSNDLILNNVTWDSDNRGYAFNASNKSYMKYTPDDAELQPVTGTAIIQIYPTSVGSQSYIAGKGKAFQGHSFREMQISEKFWMYGYLKFGTTSMGLYASNQNYNTMANYSLQWDNSTFKGSLYKENVLRASKVGDGGFVSSSEDFILGGMSTGLSMNGTIVRYILYGINLSESQRISVLNGYHETSNYVQTPVTNATAGQFWAHVNTSGTDPSTNTTASLWINGSDDNATFNGWEQVNASFNIGDNVSIGLAYQYQYATFRIYSNTTYQPETNIITNITLISVSPTSNISITSYWNNQTGNSTALTIYSGTPVEFGVTTSIIADNISWYINSTWLENDTDTTQGNLTYIFNAEGVFLINVTAINSSVSSANTTFTVTVSLAAIPPPSFTSTTPATPYHSLPNTSVTFTGTVDQTGNFTWYLNGSIVQYNNSTSTAVYTNNSSVVGGPYNITLVFTNVNGTVQYTWAWYVTEGIRVPMSLFMLMGFMVLISLFASMITTGVPAICMSMLGSMIAFINSQIAVNGQLVENIGGVASDGTVLQGIMTYELPALSYLFIFVGLILIGLTIYHISQEIQYRKDNNYTEVDF